MSTVAYERSPDVIHQYNPEVTKNETIAYGALNSHLQTRLDDFKRSHLDVHSILVDTHPIFNEVLDDPSKIGLRNSTCATDQNGEDASCVWAGSF